MSDVVLDDGLQGVLELKYGGTRNEQYIAVLATLKHHLPMIYGI